MLPVIILIWTKLELPGMLPVIIHTSEPSLNYQACYQSLYTHLNQSWTTRHATSHHTYIWTKLELPGMLWVSYRKWLHSHLTIYPEGDATNRGRCPIRHIGIQEYAIAFQFGVRRSVMALSVALSQGFSLSHIVRTIHVCNKKLGRTLRMG